MRSHLLPLLLIAAALLVGCSPDDDAPGPYQPTAAASWPITVQRYYPNATEPITSTIDAPADKNTTILADQLGTWGVDWDTSPEIAIYGRSPYWMLVRPLKAGGVVTITYTPPAPTAVQ